MTLSFFLHFFLNSNFLLFLYISSAVISFSSSIRWRSSGCPFCSKSRSTVLLEEYFFFPPYYFILAAFSCVIWKKSWTGMKMMDVVCGFSLRFFSFCFETFSRTAVPFLDKSLPKINFIFKSNYSNNIIFLFLWYCSFVYLFLIYLIILLYLILFYI